MKGSIVKRIMKDGSKRYNVVWRVNGKQKWKTFKKQKDADNFLSAAVKDTQEGTYTHVKPVVMDEVFNNWLTHYIDVRLTLGKLKPSTAKSYRSMVKTHLRPAFKDYRSDRLSAEAVEEWARKRTVEIAAGTLAPKTYNNLIVLLGVILGWARGRGHRYLAHDPLAEVDLAPRVRVERDYLEPADINKLLEAAQTPEDTILSLAVFSGLRRGEIFGLQWADLDEDAGQVRIRRSIYQGAITRPKTAHSERIVDLPTRIVDRLKAYRKTFPPLDGDFIFRASTGRPLDPDKWYREQFIPTVTRAGLRGIGLHTLRHTYASLLINQGESVKYVSKQLGHASIQITADLYSHLFKETSSSAMGRLGLRVPVSLGVDEQQGAA